MSTAQVTKDALRAMPGQYLTFKLKNQIYGVPISSVVEINQMSEITPIPDTPNYVKGVLNLRGKIIPVIDFRLKLNLEQTPYTKQTCIIVIESRQGMIGMIVDAVREVIDLESGEIEISPKLSKDQDKEYISGIGKADKDVVILIDVMRVFADESFLQNAEAA